MPTGKYIRTAYHRNLAASIWKNKKRPPFSEEWKNKIRVSLFGNKRAEGFKHSIETCQKVSRGLKGKKLGEKCNFWKGGITPINKKTRDSFEYRQWRKTVFERDDYRCFDCGKKSGEDGVKHLELNADHIYPFAQYPKLRLILENGRTLCVDCHRKTSTYGINLQKITA